MPEKKIKPLYDFGEIVYSIGDPFQMKGIVVGYEVLPSGLNYIISFDSVKNYYFAFELSATKGEVTQPKDDDE